LARTLPASIDGVCPETGRKFYDLNKDPVISPYTGKIVPMEAPVARARPEPASAAAARSAAPAEEAAVPEVQEAEFVSLEEADAEAQGAKKPVEATEAEIEEDVEMDESLDDAALIEEQEEEDANVTDIIGNPVPVILAPRYRGFPASGTTRPIGR
jgi:uncharacterized protein (TIGR02300 family)